MTRRSLPSAVFVCAAALMAAAPASAGVVVLSNRTDAKVEFTILQPDGKKEPHSLAPREVLSVPVTEKAGVVFDAGGIERRYLLRENSIHFFLPHDDPKRELIQVTLPTGAPAVKPPPAPSPAAPLQAVGVVPVKILVDDDEPAVQRIWEARFRERLKEASDIFERTCRIRFEVVAVDTWVSDNKIVDFDKSLREFEMKVDPSPARLAIGFTSQYQQPYTGRVHLGGTRGPLNPHILIREWSQHVSKAERLEVLVHELGHYLGAVHNPEYDSVMRPTLGDRRSNAREFRIGFDPANTYVMYLLGEELRSQPIASIAQVRPDRKFYLRAAYKALTEVAPKDPTATQYLELLDRPVAALPRPQHYPQPVADAVRVVVQAITVAARQNAKLPAASARAKAGPTRLAGDQLTEFYIRRAAAAAHGLPPDRAARAFLLGLGIALDRSAVLRDSPIISDLSRQAESDQERIERLSLLGNPTMRGRYDLTQHFAVSCTLCALAGARAAETTGVVRELSDSRGGTGFSFVDLAADMAGTAFAAQVLAGKVPLAGLGTSFGVKDYLPEVGTLKEGIAWKDFVAAYGSTADARFQRQQQAIREQIIALPGYKRS